MLYQKLIESSVKPSSNLGASSRKDKNQNIQQNVDQNLLGAPHRRALGHKLGLGHKLEQERKELGHRLGQERKERGHKEREREQGVAHRQERLR